MGLFIGVAFCVDSFIVVFAISLVSIDSNVEFLFFF
jgi:hypothetical protein